MGVFVLMLTAMVVPGVLHAQQPSVITQWQTNLRPADLEGIKIFGFEKDKDIYDKTVAIIVYLSEDEEHKKEIDEYY